MIVCRLTYEDGDTFDTRHRTREKAEQSLFDSANEYVKENPEDSRLRKLVESGDAGGTAKHLWDNYLLKVEILGS